MVLMRATKGYAAPETLRVFSRARDLLEAGAQIGVVDLATFNLVNAVAAPAPWLMVGLNALLLSALYLAGHPKLLARTQRRIMTLDVVHEDPVALRQDLEGRLRGRVRHVDVTEVDYVRDLMVVDVRFQEPRPTEVPGPSAGRRQPMPAWWGER